MQRSSHGPPIEAQVFSVLGAIVETPDVVYRSAIGGEAMKVDRFSGAVEQDQKQQQQAKQNQGSAVQLLVKSNLQLKLNGILS